MCVGWDGQVSRSDLQGLNRTRVQIQGRGPGPARKKDAEGPSTPMPLAFETAHPSPIPFRYGWRRGRWGGREPSHGQVWNSSCGDPAARAPLSLGPLRAAEEQRLHGQACWGDQGLSWLLERLPSGLWTRMTLAGTRASCRRTQTRPPCSTDATPTSPLCASMPAPAPDSERLEGLPHRAPSALNT